LTVQRILNAPSIIFNAPGFYVTDKRPNAGTKDEKPDGEAEAKTSAAKKSEVPLRTVCS
jgi:predicted nucleic acid-binding Zn ribbon protein